MTKLLRRKIIIREYDFIKVQQRALTKGGGHYSLYDRASFVPITKDELEKEYLIHALTETLSQDVWKPTNPPACYLYEMKKRLYCENYIHWKSRFCEHGYIWVRYSNATPETKLGWGIFEAEVDRTQ